MKRRTTKGFVLALGAVALLTRIASATPSTTYWTPAVSDIQPYGVWHLGIDNYFSLQRPSDEYVNPNTGAPATNGDLPTDLGLTVGVLPFEKLQMEVGIDFLSHQEDPLYFNAKIGTPENTLFEGSPALNLGIFNVGTQSTDKRARTDQNIIHVMAGKTLPAGLGRLHGGYYNGNDKVLLDGKGDKANDGFMIGYDKAFIPTNDYNKIIFAADYASGKNAIGGGGVGVYYFFNKEISLLTGPVFFNEKAINGDWKWTTQLDINY